MTPQRHELDHCGLYEGQACWRETFKILCEAAVDAEPSECSLDNPTLWQDFKASLISLTISTGLGLEDRTL